MKKISIIIPIYNVESYLNECLESLQKQSLIDIEVIMINDASTDNSGIIAEKFSVEDDRYIYIKNEISKGPGGARNKGLKVATGEYIFFLDSDDKVTECGLESLYNS